MVLHALQGKHRPLLRPVNFRLPYQVSVPLAVHRVCQGSRAGHVAAKKVAARLLCEYNLQSAHLRILVQRRRFLGVAFRFAAHSQSYLKLVQDAMAYHHQEGCFHETERVHPFLRELCEMTVLQTSRPE